MSTTSRGDPGYPQFTAPRAPSHKAGEPFHYIPQPSPMHQANGVHHQTDSHRKPGLSKVGSKVKPKKDFTSKEFFERLSISGLADWYSAQSICAKGFWFVIIVAFAVILALELMQSVREYYTDPIKTAIAVMPESHIAIPPIYVCPFNYIDSKRVKDEGLDELYEEIYPYIIALKTPSVFDAPRREWEKYANLPPRDNQTQRKKTLTQEEYRNKLLKLAFRPEQVFPFCDFQATLFNCTPFIQPVVDKDYGLCYRFVPDLNQTMAGFGLRFFLDLHALDFDDDDHIEGEEVLFQGAIIRFGGDAMPFVIGGTPTGPGQLVYFSLQKTYEKLITVESSATPQKCVEMEDRPEFEFMDMEYSKPACTLDCLLRAGYPLCKCIPPLDVHYLKGPRKNSSVCTQNQIPCVSRIILQELENRTCSQKCYRPCEDTTYLIQTSSMQLSSPQLDRYIERHQLSGKIPRQLDPSYWRKSMILIAVAFEKMEHLRFVQSNSATLTQLISDLGGQAGLWLGASMFTLVQMAAFVSSYCYSKIGKKKRREPDADEGSGR